MKHIKTLVFSSLALLTISNAWAASAIETTKEINAQTTITRGQIDNLLEKVNQKKVDSRFHAKDYLDQSQEIKNEVESALTKFEIKVEKDILAKASYWMDQYNSIYSSPDYSVDQKKILLAQRRDNIENQFEKLSKEYQSALSEVYALVPYSDLVPKIKITPERGSYPFISNFTSVVKVEMVGSGTMSASLPMLVSAKYKREQNNYPVFEFNGKKIDSRSQTGIGVSTGWKKVKHRDIFSVDIDYVEVVEALQVEGALLKEVYKSYIYKAIKGSCQSAICLGLRAGDYSSLVIMIETSLDRNMYLSLADGSRVVIKGLNRDITLIKKLLARVDYPEELPFDL